MSSTAQSHLSAYGCSVEWFVRLSVPHFHVARGDRPVKPFYQYEAWPVREMVLKHVTRVVREEMDDE